MMGERRKRIDATLRAGLTAFLRDLPINLDDETTLHVWDVAQRLAGLYSLTIYHAVYLELARRKNLPLATLDRGVNLSVPLLGIDTP